MSGASAGSAIKGATTSRALNSLSYAFANKATDITTAATGDLIPIIDISEDYELKFGDAANIMEILGITASATEINVLDNVTAGTVAASKAIVVDANKKLSWSMTDATSQATPLTFALTATGVGASVDGAVFSTTTAAALGTYANAINGKLDFGSAGKATGLGGAICAELDQGAGSTDGSYACFEAEYIGGTNAATGTRTSFISMNASGTVTNFDSNGFLFDVNGLTANTGKLLRTGLSQAVTATARLRCQVNGTTYYIPLCVNEALTS